MRGVNWTDEPHLTRPQLTDLVHWAYYIAPDRTENPGPPAHDGKQTHEYSRDLGLLPR